MPSADGRVDLRAFVSTRSIRWPTSSASRALRILALPMRAALLRFARESVFEPSA